MEETYNDYVQLPGDIVVEYESGQSIHKFIDLVYPDLKGNYSSAKYKCERAILSTRNEHVDAMNIMMIKNFLVQKRFFIVTTVLKMILITITLLIFSTQSRQMGYHLMNSR